MPEMSASLGSFTFELPPLVLTDNQLEQLAALIAAHIRPAEFLTPDAVCERLQITRDTLAAWERAGRLVPALREGRVIRYSSRDLDALSGQAPRP